MGCDGLRWAAMGCDAPPCAHALACDEQHTNASANVSYSRHAHATLPPPRAPRSPQEPSIWHRCRPTPQLVLAPGPSRRFTSPAVSQPTPCPQHHNHSAHLHNLCTCTAFFLPSYRLLRRCRRRFHSLTVSNEKQSCRHPPHPESHGLEAPTALIPLLYPVLPSSPTTCSSDSQAFCIDGCRALTKLDGAPSAQGRQGL
jgi:hypothetical protein